MHTAGERMARAAIASCVRLPDKPYSSSISTPYLKDPKATRLAFDALSI